jgi:hypothetical protein
MASATNIIKPILAAIIFFGLAVFFTPSISCPAGNQLCAMTQSTFFSNPAYHFDSSVQHTIALGGFTLKISPLQSYFLSSPFNMETESTPLYNLYLPTLLILMLGLYLKNGNQAFQKKCNLRAVFLLAIIASYIKSYGSMLYYQGYSDYGISLGTSIITLCFLAAFLISLEVYIERKEKYEHLYGHFMFAMLSCMLLLLAVLTFLAFFSTSSFLVHAMGLTAFLLMFIPVYERGNILKFMKKEERAIESMGHRPKAATA